MNEDSVIDCELVKGSTVPLALSGGYKPVFSCVSPGAVFAVAEGNVVVLSVPGFAFRWWFRRVVRIDEPAAPDILAVTVFIVVESDGVDWDAVLFGEVLDDSLRASI